MSAAHKSTTVRRATQPSPEGKSIIYDPATGDFACYLDGEYVGHRPTYPAAETTLNTLMMDKLHEGQYATAAELDDGSDLHTIIDDYTPEQRAFARRVGCITGVLACRLFDLDRPAAEELLRQLT